MDESLTGTESVESPQSLSQSWQSLTSANSTSAAGRKARSSEPETGGNNVERASVSLPALGAKAIRQTLARRTSKASDTALAEILANAKNGSAIDETDETESTRSSASIGVNPLLLPDAFRPPRSDVDVAESSRLESSRLSFSSLYSIGSSIFSNNRGHNRSGRNSVVISEPEGKCTKTHWRGGCASIPPAYEGRCC